MSKQQKPLSSTGNSPEDGSAPRSLAEVYRGKKPQAGPAAARKRNAAVPWMLGTLLVIVGLFAYGKFGPSGARNTAANSKPTTPQKTNAPATAPKQPEPPKGPQPRIQFASRAYDFGRAEGDTSFECSFSYTNTGVAPLELTEVNPGCSCMRLLDHTRRLEPGQSGSIKIRLETRGYTGPFAKSVFVKCNDPLNAAPMLEVKGYVFRPIELIPQSAPITLTSETPSNAATVRIINHLDASLELSGLTSSAPAVAVALHTNSPGKEFSLVVFTPPPFPTNSVRGTITLKTSATNMPTLSIPVGVNVQPLVSAFPNMVRLPALPLTNDLPYTVILRNNSTNAFKLSDAAVSAPGVKVDLQEKAPGSQYVASLTFPAGFDIKSGEKVELTVKCSHGLMPELKIPIAQQPRFTVNPVPQPAPK